MLLTVLCSLNFPEVNLYEWYPCMIASAPSEKQLEFHIATQSNWSNALAAKARESRSQSLIMRLDGPYGNLKLNFRKSPLLFLVGNSTGISPILALLKEIFFGYQKIAAKHVMVIVSLKEKAELLWFADILDSMNKNILPFAEYFSVQLIVYVEKYDNSIQNWDQLQIKQGNPNYKELLTTLAHKSVGECFMYVCGNKQMVNDCWSLSKEFTLNGVICSFNHQTFM